MATMTFRQFLRSHRREQTAIGDLARDLLADHEWKGQRSVEAARQRLAQAGASADCRKALQSAEREYLAITGEAAA